jgi:hypothetical protein
LAPVDLAEHAKRQNICTSRSLAIPGSANQSVGHGRGALIPEHLLRSSTGVPPLLTICAGGFLEDLLFADAAQAWSWVCCWIWSASCFAYSNAQLNLKQEPSPCAEVLDVTPAFIVYLQVRTSGWRFRRLSCTPLRHTSYSSLWASGPENLLSLCFICPSTTPCWRPPFPVI